MSHIMSWQAQNHADTATLTSDLAIHGSLPLNNVKVPWGRLATRTTTAPGIWTIDADLGVPKTIDVVSAQGVNCTDSSGLSCAVMASNISIGGSEVFSASFTAHAGYRLTRGIICPIPTQIFARYVRLFLVFAPVGGSYYEMRRLWIGDGFRRDSGVSQGWSVRPSSKSLFERSDSEQTQSEVRVMFQKLSYSFQGLSQTEAIGNTASQKDLQWALARAIAGQEIIVVTRLGATAHQLQRSAFYGHLAPGTEPGIVTEGAGVTYATTGPIEVWQVPF